MSDSTSSPTQQQPVSGLVSPGANPNDTNSYVPSSSVNAVAPVIAQITGGNAGNTVAGVQGAVKTDNNFFGDIAQSIQSVSTKLSAAFQAGIGVGGSPSAIAGKVDQLASQKAAAIVQAGQANANVSGQDALQKAAAATQTSKDAVMMHLDANNPDAIQSMQNMADASHQFNEHTAALNKMRSVGFFDNPAEYLINHIISIPIEKGRAQDALGSLKGTSEEMTAQTQALGARSAIDTAMNSVDTVNRAAELYKGALATATAAGIEPLIQAKQIGISAYELGVSQQNAAVNASRLAIEQQKLPAELEIQQKQLGWYDLQKQATIGQLQDRAAVERQNLQEKVTKDAQDKDALAVVNGAITNFGGNGSITNLARVPKENLEPLLTMGNNLKQFGQVATDPAAALELTKASGIPLANIPAGQLNTIHSLDQMHQEELLKATNQPQNPGQEKLSGANLKDIVNSAVNSRVMGEQNNITNKNSLFTMPSVNTIVGDQKYANNPVVQAMRPLTVDGNAQPIKREMDGSLLMNTAAGLINSGKITESQAVSALQDISKNVLNDIQTAGGFKRYGIPVQQKFPVMFQKSGAVFGSSNMPVDLFNSADTLAKLRLQTVSLKNRENVSNALTAGATFGTGSLPMPDMQRAGKGIADMFRSGQGINQ